MHARKSHPGRLLTTAAIMLALMLAAVGLYSALAETPGNPQFQRTWSRTDQPIAAGDVSRTWMWGPEANTPLMNEYYEESPGHERVVQYFDKSRMEITFPDQIDDGLWYVTNGLLVNELVSGHLQLGNTRFEIRTPATNIGVAGDVDDTKGPTYGTIAMVVDEPPAADGAVINQRLDRDGTITTDSSLNDYDVTAAQRVQVIGLDHQIAAPFWEFMNSTGIVYVNGANITAPLFVNPYYATGYPITEPYWATVKVFDEEQDVLVQCFQRRCLTYTPANDPAWQVEAGNVGQHYFKWRYETPTEPTPTPTTEPTATPEATSTPTVAPTATPNPNDPGESLIAARLVEGSDPLADRGYVYFYVPENDTPILFHVMLESVVDVTDVQVRLPGTTSNAEDSFVSLFHNATGVDPDPQGILLDGAISSAQLPAGMSIVDFAHLLATGEATVEVNTLEIVDGSIHGVTNRIDTAIIRAQLTGSEVVPAITPMPTVTGGAILHYSEASNTISYQINADRVPELLSVYLNRGDYGQPGGPVLRLFNDTEPDDVYNGRIDGVIEDGDVANVTVMRLAYDMLSQHMFISVHTVDHPDGYLRGQLEPGGR